MDAARVAPAARAGDAWSGLTAVFLDIDGTLYFKGEQIPGAAKALEWLRSAGLVLRLLTNIDSQTPAEIAAELGRAGLPVSDEEIFTPVRALRELLEGQPWRRCFFLVPAALRAEFAAWAAPPGSRPDCVVLGDCHECAAYDTLNQAFRHLMEGAELVALQPGRHYARADGLYLDTGAFTRLLEYGSSKTARVLGKPSADFFTLALSEAGARAVETLVVGDDLTTDVAGAKGVGARAILVQTGKFRPEQLAAASPQPDAVIASVAELPALLAARRAP